MTTTEYLPGVDVVVVNYRTPGDLRQFIRSFAEVQFEVPATLMVMNVEATEADTVAVEEELEAIEIPTLSVDWEENLGYARSCNAAARMTEDLVGARSSIAFFNADTRLLPGVLDHLHWNLHQNKKWGVIGPKQVDNTNRITHAGIFGTHSRPQLRGWKALDRPGLFDDVDDQAVSVSGSAYMVKRECWDELTACELYQEAAPDALGAFLPTQHYYEETFCSYHAWAHDWRVVYDGRVTMIHKWHQASKVGGVAEKVWLPESQKLFRSACDHHSIPHD